MNEKEGSESGSVSASEILQNVEEEIGSVLSIMQEYSSRLHESQEKLKSIKSQISRVNEFLDHYSSMSKKIIPVVVRRISSDEEAASAQAQPHRSTVLQQPSDDATAVKRCYSLHQLGSILKDKAEITNPTIQHFLAARSHVAVNAGMVRRYCSPHELGSTFKHKSGIGVSTTDTPSKASDKDGSQQNPDIEIIEQPEKRDCGSTGNVQKKQKTEGSSNENTSAAKDIHMTMNAKQTSKTSTTTSASASAEKEEGSFPPDEPEEIRTAIDATKGILTPSELRTFIYLVPQVDEPLLMTKVSFTTDIPLLYFQLMSLKYNIAKEYSAKESSVEARCEEARLLEAKIESVIEMVRKEAGVI